MERDIQQDKERDRERDIEGTVRETGRDTAIREERQGKTVVSFFCALKNPSSTKGVCKQAMSGPCVMSTLPRYTGFS